MNEWLADLGIPVIVDPDLPPDTIRIITKPGPVVRPQACDCGASQLAMVAHSERCASRTRGTPPRNTHPRVMPQLRTGLRPDPPRLCHPRTA